MPPKKGAIRRGRKKREPSPPSSSDPDDLLEPDTDVKLDLHKDEEDAEDDFKPKQRKKTKAVLEEPATVLTANPLKHAQHVCIMHKMSEIKSLSASGRCNATTPMIITLKDLISHYYLHYRERGFWDTVVPVPTSTDNLRIDSYQCKLCDHKFRCRQSDPGPARSSFIYHYATYHGKIIEAMREERELDMTPVLELLNKYNPDMRKFIIDGTNKEFDDAPCIIRESCDWKLQQTQVWKEKNGAGDLNGQIIRQPNYLPCPKNDRKDCKELEKNKDVNSLKLHLFYHYLDYWRDTVPEMTAKDVKCEDCSKRVSAETPEACRTSMICHRAIIHDELKMAIEEDIEEFDQNLFNRLFNPAAYKPPQVLYSKTNPVNQTQNQALPPSTVPKPAVPSKPAVPAKPVVSKPAVPSKPTAVKSKPPAGKRAVKGVSKAEKVKKEKKGDESSSDEDVIIPTQPYVRKRIKQNLSNIDFEEDSDKDEEWQRKEKKRIAASKIASAQKRPKRRAAKTNFADHSDSE